MLVCSCNVISLQEIEDVIISQLEEDCWRLITPVQVYHLMEQRGKCCGCFPNVINIIYRLTEQFHRQQETEEAQIISLLDKLKQKHQKCETALAIARVKRHTQRVA